MFHPADPQHRGAKAFAFLAAFLAFNAACAAEEAAEPPPAGVDAVRVIDTSGQTAPPASVSDVERYCGAVAEPAREARIAAQQRQLEAVEARVNARIDELEKKRADYQAWLKERQAFLDSTSDAMTGIYATMKPDAAAAQLAALDRPAAAAVLVRLKPRTAGAILSEMSAPIAAELGGLITEKLGRTPDGATVGTPAAKG